MNKENKKTTNRQKNNIISKEEMKTKIRIEDNTNLVLKKEKQKLYEQIEYTLIQITILESCVLYRKEFLKAKTTIKNLKLPVLRCKDFKQFSMLNKIYKQQNKILTEISDFYIPLRKKMIEEFKAKEQAKKNIKDNKKTKSTKKEKAELENLLNS